MTHSGNGRSSAPPKRRKPGPRNDPPFRRLRIYAFDPTMATSLDTAVLNDAVVKVRWEDLKPGPRGDYLEVIDVDPASEAFYEPVDLDDSYLLAQDGHVPSEGNPQFHQQMVYAVAMMTIENFELALGRRIFWSPREEDVGDPNYVRRLRIYPHALREANAYYSPKKKALLFGYFPASTVRPGRNLPGGVVFTSLSNDIIAHETTHAILDGLHRRYIEPSNPDSLAFHEAFADIVALFQHFTMPEALRHQIARMHGDLSQRSLLSELAQQFGEAIGSYGALRSAIDVDEIDPVTKKPKNPDPTLIDRTSEPHDRGAILVAAVFDAFLSIYRTRIADLLRLTTGSSAAFPDEDLHPDLANRLTAEANKSAMHVLRMCIRALDYLPPVDVTFGEYLRALITADADLVPDDDLGYRIAMIEAFRRRGIYPPDCRSLAVDNLLWNAPDEPPAIWLNKLNLKFKPRREDVWERTKHNVRVLRTWLESLRQDGTDGGSASLKKRQMYELGLDLGEGAPPTIHRNKKGLPEFEIHSVRIARRVGPDAQNLPQLVIEITQSRDGYAENCHQEKFDGGDPSYVSGESDFTFRGGCTLIVDMKSSELRYCIRKRVDNRERLEAQRKFLFASESASLAATYFGMSKDKRLAPSEPFALLHRGL